ncbi:MAG TPA: metallophosphoesterase family protein [Candidatus Krumholzibacterium sp.]|nr:metallophosphoesterase family protein [Candidatus Krumholzibacterium sp.]
MTEKRIALVADIHGNRWALEAVIEDIGRRSVQAIFNLGDSLYGPLDPQGTYQILAGLGALSVLGNEDRIILADPGRHHASPTLEFTLRSLSGDATSWLAAQRPIETVGGRIRMFHGTPRSDGEYLLRQVLGGTTVPRQEAEVALLAGAGPEEVILCAHDHTPGVMRLGDGRLVVDPGSVGLQAYRDDLPEDHSIGSGDPRASYAVVEKAVDGWAVDLVRVEYDHESAALAAEKNGREDWASWLRSGSA